MMKRALIAASLLTLAAPAFAAEDLSKAEAQRRIRSHVNQTILNKVAAKAPVAVVPPRAEPQRVTTFVFDDVELTNTPVDYATVTITTSGGPVDVTATFRIWDNFSDGRLTLFYGIRNVTLNHASGIARVFQVSAGTVTSTTITDTSHEHVPAGTYTYALQVFASGSFTAPHWLIEAAEITAVGR